MSDQNDTTKPKSDELSADSALSASPGSPSDTPETDDLLLKINEGRVYADECPTVGLSRKLERERDQARQYAEQLRITNGYKANDEVIFPWENADVLAPAGEKTPTKSQDE